MRRVAFEQPQCRKWLRHSVGPKRCGGVRRSIILAQSLLGLSEKRSSGRNRSRSPGMGPDGGLRGARRRPHGGHRTGSGWTRITPDRSPPRWRVRQPRWPRPPAIAAAHAPAPTRDRLVRSSTRERPAPGGRRRRADEQGGRVPDRRYGHQGDRGARHRRGARAAMARWRRRRGFRRAAELELGDRS